MKTIKALKLLDGKLAKAAQEVYDAWDENEDEYGGGGICHLIADAMVDVLTGKGIEATSVGQEIGEVHVYVVAQVVEGVYRVDIPPSTYESGSGYSWTKRKGVKLDRLDVVIDRLSSDPEAFDEFTE